MVTLRENLQRARLSESAAVIVFAKRFAAWGLETLAHADRNSRQICFWDMSYLTQGLDLS
jgi:hypothetical protein